MADRLVRTLEIPVLLVRAGDEAPAQPPPGGLLLVPLDGSPLAEDALGPAVALARLLDADVQLVQVVRPAMLPTDASYHLPSTYDEATTAIFRREAQDYLDDMAEQVHSAYANPEAERVLGWSAAETLLELSRSKPVGLIAIATHGRSGLRRAALGSVADKLVRGAPVPVLVSRPRGGRRARD